MTVNERMGVLPPPYPPLPVEIWQNEVPKMRCPFCGSTFDVSKGVVKCPGCETEYLALDWNWETFLIGLGVGLLVGLVISAGIYYFVLRPYVPAIRLATTFREILKV